MFKHLKSGFKRSILNHPFCSELDAKACFILILGALAYIITFTDITSELAAEKDEISSMAAVLNKIDNPDSSSLQICNDLPETGNVTPSYKILISQNDILKNHSDRAPPPI